MNRFNQQTVNIPEANLAGLQQAMIQNATLNQQMGAAQRLTDPNVNNGWGGGAGILAAALGGFMQNKKAKDLAANENDINQQIMQFQAQKEQEAAMLAQQARDKEARDKLNALIPTYGEEKARAIVFGGVDPGQFKEQGPTELQRNLSDPMVAEYLNRKADKSGISVTNNMPGGETATEFQKKLAGKNADKFTEWENAAYSANETMSGINQLRQISDLQKTGRGQEAMGLVSQWFGSEAGANMQSFNSIASNLVLQQAEKLKGAMSDGDIKLLESTMPQFGNDPRANEVIFSVLERASERAIKRYDDAFKYSQEHGKLQGYKPEFQYSRQEQASQPQQQSSEYQEGDTATNPQTGERVVFRNGQWVKQ